LSMKLSRNFASVMGNVQWSCPDLHVLSYS
jgi:hypothetical protein